MEKVITVARHLKIEPRMEGWKDGVQWAQRYCKGKSKGAGVYKMVLAAAVCQVWQERNFRIFQQSTRPQHVIIRQIVQEVFHRATMWQHKTMISFPNNDFLPGLANWHTEKSLRSIRLTKAEAFFIWSSVA
ncbi:hypothetical protein H5410_049152 [Solanum commersonii]|uniref:Uncharacterized protein n=1 Tax=Solanum commersonii TaxID=4109 RepID=A0A9J5XNX2_SOLCO|nr:hypothetical protein H5410_049152 [Solanum commersonii]